MNHRACLFSVFVMSLMVIGMTSCTQNGTASQNAQRINVDDAEEMLTQIELGEKRVFTDGALFPPLQATCRNFVHAHPELALGLLKAKVKSDKVTVRSNARDFASLMLDVPQYRKEVEVLVRSK
jgi:hypothetical protein